jgi:hypothetical protein
VTDPIFKQFLRPDGSITFKMKNLIYGYKEPDISGVVSLWHGYYKSFWDRCLLIKHDKDRERTITVTVHDSLCGVSSKIVKEEIIEICKSGVQG